jgi:hypothetical protein
MGRGRRHHSLALPEEQRIAQLQPQAIERVADGGLRQVELDRCRGHAARRMDGVEYTEQVEVNASH